MYSMQYYLKTSFKADIFQVIIFKYRQWLRSRRWRDNLEIQQHS